MKRSDIVPFTSGTHTMWDDPHISKQLLKFHLDPDLDAASRRPEIINRTIEWICTEVLKGPSKVLDLGCGPGLYCERLASRGHLMTGLDLSSSSIGYGVDSARKKDLQIEYIQGDYMKDDLPKGFDMAMIIYCDLGVFGDNERDLLLRKVHGSLKKGGTIVFDVAGTACFDELKGGRTSEISPGGFWSDEPYVHLEEILKFPELKAVLHEHSVVMNDNEIRTYRFWDRHYTVEGIRDFLEKAGFSDIEFRDDIVIETNFRTSDVIFVSARKV